MASNLPQSSFLSFLSTRTRDVNHHTWLARGISDQGARNDKVILKTSQSMTRVQRMEILRYIRNFEWAE